MLPILQIGPFAIQTPGLVLLAGVWVGLWLAERYADRFEITGNQIYNLALLSIGAGLIGARLAYILRYPDAFLVSPASAFSLNPGLLDPLAGIVTAIIAALIYGQRLRVPILDTLDAVTPFLATMMIAINLANLASGSAFGIPAELPWSIDLWGAQRHPSQLYNLLAGIFVLGLVIWMIRRNLSEGMLFLIFLSASAASVLVLEAFRADSHTIALGIRSAQVVAWIVLAVSLLAIWHRSRGDSNAR